MSKIYTQDEIKKILPHRDPFLFVDKMEILEEGVEGIGHKSITMKEDFFRGHFPNNPIMPGVLQVEAMAQAAGCVIISALPDYQDKPKGVFFMSIDNVKFRHPIVPDAELELHVKKVKGHGKVFVCEGKVYVNKVLCSEALLTAMITG